MRALTRLEARLPISWPSATQLSDRMLVFTHRGIGFGAHQSFQYFGTTVTISAQIVTDGPSFQKSPKRYPPSPYAVKLTPLAKSGRRAALEHFLLLAICARSFREELESVAGDLGADACLLSVSLRPGGAEEIEPLGAW